MARAETASDKGRTRAAHLGPERRRPMVLDAAIRLFLDNGYDGTSMEAIAEVAGVTKPVVYRCYPNKKELFRALLEREEGTLTAAILAAMPTEVNAEDTEAVLIASLTALFTAAVSRPDSWRIIYASEHGSEPVIQRRVQRSRDGFVDQITLIIEPLLKDFGVQETKRKAPVLAAAIAAIAESGVRTLLADPGAWEPAELAELLGRSTMRGPTAI